MDWILSAGRPAQPVSATLSRIAVCICASWSECEQRFMGTPTPPWQSGRTVVGCTSVPTFASTGRCLLLNSDCIAEKRGWKAKGDPMLEGAMGSSEPCTRARPPRADLYPLYPVVSYGITILLLSLPPNRKTQTSAL